MFKDWRAMEGIEDPHTGWLKINLTGQRKTLYERQQGAFRLTIMVESDHVSIGFTISEDDFSVCHVPADPSEIQYLLSHWTTKKKMTDPTILAETREAAKHG